jgi:hypothetical protein
VSLNRFTTIRHQVDLEPGLLKDKFADSLIDGVIFSHQDSCNPRITVFLLQGVDNSNSK